MSCVLANISAARFWASYGAGTVPQCSVVPVANAPTAAPDQRDLDEVRRLGLFLPDEPIHALVSNPAVRRHGGDVVFHVCASELPQGSICRISSRLYVTSPGLSLVQLGKVLELPELAFVAIDLCSIFAFGTEPELVGPADDPREQRYSRRLVRRAPITTTENLSAFASKAGSMQGASRAKRAIAETAMRARSPMEAALLLHFRLAPKYGGYRLPMPRLNCPVEVAPGRTVEADFCWPEKHVVVEYLGSPYHTGRQSVRRDSKRANDYSDAGYEMLLATGEHLENLELLDAIAKRIARATGKRLRLPEDFSEKQRDLRRRLAAVRRAIAPDLVQRPGGYL